MTLATLALSVLAQAAPVKVEIPGTPLSFETVEVPAGKDLKAFVIGRREVTWAEYNAYFESKDQPAGADAVTRPTQAKSYFGQVGVPETFLEPAKPLTNVRWHGAIGYCDWLSKKTGHYWRLPTEPEWEHAARGGETAPVPAALDDVAWHQATSGERTHLGAEKKPNGFGLYDAMGNVWEYVLEFKSGSAFDPVLKGGCWSTPREQTTFAARSTVPLPWFEADPNRPRSVWWLTFKDVSQGFRLVKAADAVDKVARATAAAKVEVKAKFLREKTVKIEERRLGDDKKERVDTAQTFFVEVEVEIRNGGDQALEEVEVAVWYVDPKGKPHLADVSGANKAGQATFSKAWPVLARAAQPAARPPLAPGESRTFTIDLPQTFDQDDEVEREKFGGKAANVRLATR